tara:strand:- start:9 stop:224 length:216 start_codon:yes stop_codon:yes gene_type:complete
LGQIARPCGFVELRLNQSRPGGFDGIKGAWKHEHKGAIGNASKASALQRAGANRLERQHTEELPESIDRLV